MTTTSRSNRRRAGRVAVAIATALAVTGGIGASRASALPFVSIEAGPDATTPEGALFTRSIAIVDGQDNGTPGWTFAIDYGDGTPVATGTTLVPTIELSHGYDDGPSTFRVSVSAVDHLGLIDEVAFDTFVLTVDNVAPTITLSGAASTPVGTPYALTLGAIADPGRFDTVTSRVIRWGDGTSQTLTAGGDVAHTYTTAGTKAIAVDLIDEDGTFLDAGTLTTTATAVAPTAPGNLTATALSRASIRLGWTNTAADQTAVLIERCAGTGCTSFKSIATVAGTATTFTDTRLSSRTVYTYRVRARNAVGSSPYSATAAVRTLRWAPLAPSAPAAPQTRCRWRQAATMASRSNAAKASSAVRLALTSATQRLAAVTSSTSADSLGVRQSLGGQASYSA